MLRRLAASVAGLLISAFAADAQSAADQKACDQAIGGSARDRIALQTMATARPVTSPTALFAAGCLDVMASRWDSAAAHFDAAAKGNPKSSAAFLWVGNITGQLARLGDGQTKVRLAPAVKDAYLKAIALDGMNLDAHEGLLQFLLQMPLTLGGDKEKAAEQAIAIGKVNAFRGLSAQLAVASALNDRPALERLLSRATTQFPDSILGWANLSAMQADDKRPAEAFATITRWQATHRNPMFALFSIGRTAAVTGEQLDRGVQALQQFLRGQRAPNDPPFANAHYRLAQIFEKQHRNPDARAEYAEALKLNPNLRDARVGLDRVK
jgi:tetratricopeptide (TPR) repeat protein